MTLYDVIYDFVFNADDELKYKLYILYAKDTKQKDWIPIKMEEFNSYFGDKTEEEIEDMADIFDYDDEYFWIDGDYLYSGTIEDFYGELGYEWVAKWLEGLILNEKSNS